MKSRSMAAILAVFPTVEEFENFLNSEGSEPIIDSLLAFAARAEVIPYKEPGLLRELIESHGSNRSELIPPHRITMEALLDNKEDFLKTGLSGRGLVARINALLERLHVALPRISNTMLTRIKKEPADTLHKQNVLRSLAFWLGFEKNELSAEWNYATLLKICKKTERSINAREGVRIGFSLVSRGDIIEQDIIIWLKKNIKQFIKANIDMASNGQWGMVHVYDITTLCVDFPKEEGISELSCYQESIRNAISVGHQMAIRWALSPFATKKRFLVVGIAAGNFTTLDNYIQPLLNANLPGDPVIRISDFARQCIMVNDIRAICNNQPKEVTLFNGEQLTIWWIVGLWSSIYWPFVPALLEDDVISNTSLLKNLLNINYSGESEIAPQGQTNAVTALLQSPQNTLLGMEITKTLYYRNKFFEALEILRIILSTNPANLNARCLRMMIYRNLGANARAYTVAVTQFKRAEKEAEFIMANCSALDEDFYDELAVLQLARAITILRFMRKHRGVPPDHDIHLSRCAVSQFLDKAEHLFETGICVSPSGTRSLYLLICVRMLKRILSWDEDIYINPDKPIAIPVDIAREPALDMFYAMGFLDEAIAVEQQIDELGSALFKMFQGHNNALALDAYRPTVYFCYAAVLWDFFPIRSIETARHTIQMLESAIETARKSQADRLYIYSYTRFHGEMLPPDVFISQLSGLLLKIKAHMAHMDGSRPFAREQKTAADQFLLFSHYIDQEIIADSNSRLKAPCI